VYIRSHTKTNETNERKNSTKTYHFGQVEPIPRYVPVPAVHQVVDFQRREKPQEQARRPDQSGLLETKRDIGIGGVPGQVPVLKIKTVMRPAVTGAKHCEY